MWRSWIALGLLVLLMALAVIFDLRQRKVPNALVLLGALAAFGLHLWVPQAQSDGPDLVPAGLGLGGALAGAATGMALMLPFWLKGGLGAGDVKLMGMLGAFLGPLASLNVVLIVWLVGGLTAVIWVLGSRRYRRPEVPSAKSASMAMPYVPVIATGVFIHGLMVWRGVPPLVGLN